MSTKLKLIATIEQIGAEPDTNGNTPHYDCSVEFPDTKYYIKQRASNEREAATTIIAILIERFKIR